MVIKVGGSLMNHPYQLREILKIISDIAEQRKVLIVPGGAYFANRIRELHSRKYLSDSAAHWLAIRCMDLSGSLMADMQPSWSLYSGIDAFKRWADGESFIIQPYELLKSHDRLPHSWDVTSDSISLWMGIQGEADAVLILKSISPFMKWWSVIQSETDAVRPESLKGDFYVLNGLRPENLSEIINKQSQ
ncbi:MAG: amino acid kinase family protein [Candidatus Thorarchaeota archaeon SMTZ1-83]